MSQAPDLMPVLSPGRHRNPRRGACFMEMASYLAGERWSDHPRCTHPLLAALARDVNDRVGDDARSRIVRLVPDVVGVQSDDPRSYAWIAREATIAALPVAPALRQPAIAVGLIRCQLVLDPAEGRPGTNLDAECRAALDSAPVARDWALDFVRMGVGSDRDFVRRAAPAIVRSSVAGIAEACVRDADDRLVTLLERSITLSRSRFGPEPSRVAAPAVPVQSSAR
jgi:hypothetical protein